MSKTEQKKKRQELLNRVIKKRTHSVLSIKIPTELHQSIKRDANKAGMKLSPYACNLLQKGGEAAEIHAKALISLTQTQQENE